jgi:23S rRNA pseudouridine1911/1915/1917 synthase
MTESSTRSYTAEKAERVDHACHRLFPNLSRRSLKVWLRAHPPRVDGRMVAPGMLLLPGMCLEVDEPLQFKPSETQEEIEPSPQEPSEADKESPYILFQDSFLIALYKPQGWPSHPIHPWEKKTASQWLLQRAPFLFGVGTEQRAPGLLHRLDNTTSGILLFAKTQESFLFFKSELKEKRWRKEYLSCVQGCLSVAQEVTELIAHHPDHPKKMAVFRELSPWNQKKTTPQTARTKLTPLAYHPTRDETLVHVRIETGVRHQIRVHLAHLQHPILGDVLYGGRPDLRLWLHAWALLLPSPTTQAYALYAPWQALQQHFPIHLPRDPYGGLFETMHDATLQHLAICPPCLRSDP